MIAPSERIGLLFIQINFVNFVASINRSMPYNLIIKRYCEIKGLTLEELTAVSRNPEIWFANYMLWYYLHCEMKVSIGKMCKIFKRTRPSIFRGIRILRQQMFYHKDINERYESMREELERISSDTRSNDIMEEKN